MGSSAIADRRAIKITYHSPSTVIITSLRRLRLHEIPLLQKKEFPKISLSQEKNPAALFRSGNRLGGDIPSYSAEKRFLSVRGIFPGKIPGKAFLQETPVRGILNYIIREGGFPLEQRHRPECRYAEKCGGCQLQNLTYPEQLAFKQRKMEALLGKFCPVAPIIGMKNPWHYRNKVQAAFGFSQERGVVSGIYQSSSHRIVPVSHCLIEDEAAGAIIRTIRELMPEFKITAYDEHTGTGFLRHVLVKRGFATGEVMVVLVVTEPIFKLQKPFLKKLLELRPEITTVVLNFNDRFGPVVLGDQERALYGKGYIEDVLCGLTFRISAKSFYQVNPVQAEILYGVAVNFAALTGKERVLDAYCSIGAIGMAASRHAGEVLGVELGKDAVRDAIANARRNGIQNCWFTQGDAGEYLAGMAKERIPLDVAFLDPPRDGSDRKFLSSLLAVRPKRIVYLSCGPESLARDLQILTEGGYLVKKIQPVDMFPHTEHVETIVLMSRVKE